MGCTTKDRNGSYWCATELTPNSRSNKKHNLNWGFCGAGCPKGLHICKLLLWMTDKYYTNGFLTTNSKYLTISFIQLRQKS